MSKNCAAVLAAALLGFGLTGWPAGPALAADPGPEIRAVIAEQIEAFRADDIEAAYALASPSIRRVFPDAQRFGQMVRNGYPMVWRPAEVSFAGLTERRGRFYQGVVVIDENGALHILEYEMVQGADGWQINGVSFRRDSAAGA